MSIFSQISRQKIDKLVNKKDRVVTIFRNLCAENTFNYALSGRKSDSIKNRYKLLFNKLKEIFND